MQVALGGIILDSFSYLFYYFHMVIPLFKTHYSIGKSILTLNCPSKVDKNGPDSVIDIALDAGLKEVVIIEDSMHGFLETKKRCEENKLKLIFGIRINLCQQYEVEKNKVPSHKIVIFAKGDRGVKKLYKIYSKVFCDHGGKITEPDLKKMWTKKDLMLAIPFYDSFIYQNNLKYGANFMHSFDYYNPIFFLEDNGLPYDNLLRDAVLDFTELNKFPTQEVKSIYYRNRKDFTAFQTYKMITNRNFSKRASIKTPQLDGCGSDEFCMESFLEK
tara:strand:- start:2296 stop:3114 length:819 start_codon:yes stop_codon:yes gene_type:complete